MIINHSQKENIPALRQLWQKTFGDTDAFLDSFFSSAFAEARSLCVIEDARILGAVYWFDCIWADKKVAYIYALAVEEACRGQKIGVRLMEEARRVLAEQGYQGICLVPGEDWLFVWYEKLGYRPFGFSRKDCIAAELPAVPVTEVLGEDYCLERNRILGPSAVLQMPECFPFLESFCRFWAGRDYLLCGTLEDGTLYLQEYLGACKNLPGIAAALGAEKAVFSQMTAMYLSLDGDTALPNYFGIPMD